MISILEKECNDGQSINFIVLAIVSTYAQDRDIGKHQKKDEIKNTE
jgi:hypothetical protein